jgi:cobalt-zinc-cadmium efflux system protein
MAECLRCGETFHMASGQETPGAQGPRDRERRKGRLRGALIVTASYLVIEVVGGLLSGSLSLLADATHMFTDVAALTLAYAAMTLAERAPTRRYTFGLYRAEILAAFVNAQILLVIAAYIFYAAYQRFRYPPEIATDLMFWVAIGGLIANLVSMRLLHGGHRESLNVRAAYMEVVADTLGSLGVIGASLLMAATRWYWVDALVSLGIGLFILPRTLSLLKQSAHILLEGTPAEMNMSALTDQIHQVPGVEEVHDLHVWTLTSGLHAASLHIRVDEDGRGRAALSAVRAVLREHTVDHATIQVEWGPPGACHTSELEF